MRKILVGLMLLAMLVIIPKPCPAGQCQTVWDNIAGHNFVLTVGDQEYDVEFSDSYIGPCPAGIVEVYDGIYIAPRITCPYRSSGDSSVVLELGDNAELDLYWWNGKLTQIIIPENAIILEPDNEE